MRDPYQVLGVSSTPTDEEIKKAYRNLARKYHPDNYHDNPLADLAQERMKEINEAYEAIQSQRKGGGQPSYGAYGYQNAGNSYGGYTGSTKFQRVRSAINQGDLNLAEELLNASSDRGAEWHYLKGAICYRRGWMDEARRYYTTACQIDPSNGEYRQALDYMENGSSEAYHPGGTVFGTELCGDSSLCMRMCCAYMLCNGFGFPICCYI